MAMLVPGTLRQLAVETTQRALATGALQPIATRCDRIDDQGIPFLVRQVDSLLRKERAKQQRQREKPKAPNAEFNPFLPYEPELFVTDLSPTHLVLLNKFNVVDHHLLMVTRAFEEQESLLTLADFGALALTLVEMDGLVFYNGGKLAGASQRHKHLQWVPRPMADWGPGIPVVAVLGDLGKAGRGVVRSPGLPFSHGLVSLAGLDWGGLLLGQAQQRAAELFQLYQELLAAVGLAWQEGLLAGGGYNLLVTRDWMLLVPRRAEAFEEISVNSLGFAGSMFVRNGAELERLQAIGPMAVLQAVAQA
jgi:sulfate adenylyltransferase (ADP) / ATP adenylyltransferase